MLFGCASSDSGSTPVDAAAPTDATSAAQPGDAGAGAAGCTPGQTAACVCSDGGVGQRSCIDGEFAGDCAGCANLDTSTGTLCEPGRYSGLLTVARFYPAAAGLCGLVTVFGAEEGTDIEVDPGPIAFEIESEQQGEFFYVTGVGNCFEIVTTQPEAADASVGDAGAGDAAVADGGAGISPVGLGLTGELDCATGVFTGELRGVYETVSLCDQENQQHFSVKGTLRATYNPETRTFEDGEWSLHEPPQLLDPFCVPLDLCKPPGGTGTWEASHQGPSSSADTGERAACYDEANFEDFDITGL